MGVQLRLAMVRRARNESHDVPLLCCKWQCRAVHEGLEAHTGSDGVTAAEKKIDDVKQQCITTFNWQEADTPPFPSSRNNSHYFGKKGKGKGKGKGTGKGKGKGS